MAYELPKRLVTSGSALRLRVHRPEAQVRFHAADERLGEIAVGALITHRTEQSGSMMNQEEEL